MRARDTRQTSLNTLPLFFFITPHAPLFSPLLPSPTTPTACTPPQKKPSTFYGKCELLTRRTMWEHVCRVGRVKYSQSYVPYVLTELCTHRFVHVLRTHRDMYSQSYVRMYSQSWVPTICTHRFRYRMHSQSYVPSVLTEYTVGVKTQNRRPPCRDPVWEGVELRGCARVPGEPNNWRCVAVIPTEATG